MALRLHPLNIDAIARAFAIPQVSTPAKAIYDLLTCG